MAHTTFQLVITYTPIMTLDRILSLVHQFHVLAASLHQYASNVGGVA